MRPPAAALPALLALAAAASSCAAAEAPPPVVEPTPTAVAPPTPEGPPPHVIEEGPAGVHGGPCDVDEDCAAAGAVCLRGAFPRGTCSATCTSSCPAAVGDRDGVCAGTFQLPDDAQQIGDGACLASCDYGRFRSTGCREGYGCVPLARPKGTSAPAYACMPGDVGIDLSPCMEALAAKGVSFTPLEKDDEAPRFLDGALCRVDDGVLLRPPLAGVEFVDGSGKANPIVASCDMAVALVDAAAAWRARGVARVTHFGTYACRKIAGKPRLSRHADGNAIDVGGFLFDDGRKVSVLHGWSSADGKLLRALVDELKAQGPWTTILTPDTDWDHRDHFHLDLKGKGPTVVGRVRTLQ